MGRRRGYDERTVLSSVMHAFRRGGYAGASVRELEEAASLSAGSLYHAYGGKAGLFDAAFRHYNMVVLHARLDRHAPPMSGLDGLRELFRSLLYEPDGKRLGCLITNTAVEFGAEAVHPRVREGLAALERTFTDRLRESAASAWPEEQVRTGAIRLLALYQGVLVLLRAGHDPAQVEQAIMLEFDNLKESLDEH